MTCDISIMFATRDRADVLRQSLEGYFVMDTAGLKYEIIVIDNGSRDDTPAVLSEMAERLPLRSYVEPAPGKNRCLNRATALAKGRLWMFTDDDVLPDASWLHAYVEAAQRFPEEDVFGGRIEPVFPDDTPEWVRGMSPLVQKFAFSRFDPGLPLGPMRNSPTGPNMMLRRRVFDEFSYNETIGPAGKDYAMGSETELFARLREAGRDFIYVPASRVGHIIRPEQTTLTWLAGRAYRLGRGQMASEQLKGPVGKLVARSVWQAIITLPVYLATFALSPRRRFWSVWHWHKTRGRFAQLRYPKPILAAERSAG